LIELWVGILAFITGAVSIIKNKGVQFSFFISSIIGLLVLKSRGLKFLYKEFAAIEKLKIVQSERVASPPEADRRSNQKVDSPAVLLAPLESSHRK